MATPNGGNSYNKIIRWPPKLSPGSTLEHGAAEGQNSIDLLVTILKTQGAETIATTECFYLKNGGWNVHLI